LIRGEDIRDSFRWLRVHRTANSPLLRKKENVPRTRAQTIGDSLQPLIIHG
jgi:hypothetical protein